MEARKRAKLLEQYAANVPPYEGQNSCVKVNSCPKTWKIKGCRPKGEQGTAELGAQQCFETNK